jgi:hypothetical protein
VSGQRIASSGSYPSPAPVPSASASIALGSPRPTREREQPLRRPIGSGLVSSPFTVSSSGNVRKGSPLPRQASAAASQPMSRGRTGQTVERQPAVRGGSPMAQPRFVTGQTRTSSPMAQPQPRRVVPRSNSPLGLQNSPRPVAAPRASSPTQHYVFSQSMVPNASSTVNVRGQPISAVPSSVRPSSPMVRRAASPTGFGSSAPRLAATTQRPSSPMGRAAASSPQASNRVSSPARLAEQYLSNAPASSSRLTRETNASLLRRQAAMR